MEDSNLVIVNHNQTEKNIAEMQQKLTNIIPKRIRTGYARLVLNLLILYRVFRKYIKIF